MTNLIRLAELLGYQEAAMLDYSLTKSHCWWNDSENQNSRQHVVLDLLPARSTVATPMINEMSTYNLSGLRCEDEPHCIDIN